MLCSGSEGAAAATSEPTDAKREIKAFEVALRRVLGQKNGRGAGSFIEETRSQLLDFYGEVVQNLTPWVARAPVCPPPTKRRSRHQGKKRRPKKGWSSMPR